MNLAKNLIKYTIFAKMFKNMYFKYFWQKCQTHFFFDILAKMSRNICFLKEKYSHIFFEKKKKLRCPKCPITFFGVFWPK